jgi:hypothetical protein
LLIHGEFSQFFVADSSAEVRDRRTDSAVFILVPNNTPTVYHLRACPIDNSSNFSTGHRCASTFEPCWYALVLQPSRMPPSIATQWPSPPSHLQSPCLPCQTTLAPCTLSAEATILPGSSHFHQSNTDVAGTLVLARSLRSLVELDKVENCCRLIFPISLLSSCCIGIQGSRF